jgi:hypothetical protein
MATAILSTTYFGPVSYYCKLFGYDHILLEQHEHYTKQTYRNRCIIASPSGPQPLTVPVERDDTSHTEVRDVRLSDHGKWQHLHWQAIRTAYDGSPYFEFYADDLLPLFEHRYSYLLDFNEALRAVVCELIDLHPDVRLTDEFVPIGEEGDFRNVISPKSKQPDPTFRPAVYHQVFENRLGFLPDLSILDLLFNMGPESLLILRDSIVPEACPQASGAPLRPQYP